jgi:serine protease Do
LVGEVVPNSPADKAGLKDGDVIISFNGAPVNDSRHLKLDVAGITPGEKVPVEIVRDGSHKAMEVNVKELADDGQLARNSAGENPQDNGTLQGVAVGDVDAQARQQFNIPDHVKGAVVTEVAPESAAAQAGLKPGDVIMEINHHSVAKADDAVKLTERTSNKITLLRVWSGDGSHYMVVDENNKVG